ncbi:DUF885 domain-containing protein [Erythrobacter sanguineus]|uniref:Uncharacterized conserved protein, DUF885 familyt n=1 Tax=Erythrobacter sanguineus TaxID=198312 RepID=A0A1M7STT2_9SPHN|nr:DUF885 domain-containing protein [Erythrobacter sanguineus]SHN61967.1 Uncharacterized conserved protein, DUF885 familyt [Erythrobacter sanguineus]
MTLIRLLAAPVSALALCAALPAPLAAQEVQADPVAALAELPAEAGIDELFAAYDAASLAMSPQGKAYRGIRDADYGKWDDRSDAAADREYALLQQTLATMQARFDPAELAPQQALSYRLFEALAARRESLRRFRDYGYIFDQMNGAQSRMPAFLINIHRVSSEGDALAYVERIAGMGPVLDALTAQSRERAEKGAMPPRWVYPYVISDIRNLLDAGDGNAVLADLASKVERLDLAADTKAGINGGARDEWWDKVVPAYQRLLAEMERQQQVAPTDDGVWRLPEGAAYYGALLANYTTTDLTADEIHAIGLSETDRIHGEMRAIMAKVGFEGTLQDFFAYTRDDPRFFHTTREDYLAEAEAHLAAMTERLPEFFTTLPKDPLVIKPVEAFREKSAGKAFYQSPAPDGSRPGTYYVNLYNLRDMSRNELEALAYHEGLPGHHLQRSIQTGLGDLPAFRRFGGVTAYSEGWGLYSEELGKDMGFYTDPFSDFGRLGMELWRAGRLVVDTGIHDKRWSREEAIAWLAENTPNPLGDIEKAIERYIVYPGQATAYMIGKLKIMELRERARAELGDGFDIRDFHHVILTSGPVPLSILEENVEQWVAEARTS